MRACMLMLMYVWHARMLSCISMTLFFSTIVHTIEYTLSTMSKILLLVCIVIVVIILYERTRMRTQDDTRIPSRSLSNAIDSNDVRHTIASTQLDATVPKPALMGLITTNTTMSSDDLFAIATANMRIMEDMRDLADQIPATSKEMGAIRTQYIIARERAQAAMSRAIAIRATEDSTRRHAITDDVMQDRAREFNRHVDKQQQQQHQQPIIVDIPRANDKLLEHDDNKPKLAPTWSHDPENVHDSLVGTGVAHKLNVMRTSDQHVTDSHNLFGSILDVINTYTDEHTDARAVMERRANARHTLHVASADASCSRYGITEFDALRLVYERSLRANIDENTRANMRNALVTALADCSPNKSSVCLVGRITRYVGALDVVDPDASIGSAPIMNVDAHRATLFAKLGQLQVQGKTSQEMREYVNQYFASDPALSDQTNKSIQKIKSDALAGIED